MYIDSTIQLSYDILYVILVHVYTSKNEVQDPVCNNYVKIMNDY